MSTPAANRTGHSSNEFDDYEENIALEGSQALLHKNTIKYDEPFYHRYKKWIVGTCFSALVVFITAAVVVGLLKKSNKALTIADQHEYTTSNGIPWIENPQTNKITKQATKKPKNVIMMISDGLGPASVSFARYYYQYVNSKPYDYQMPLDKLHVGQSRTRSASTLVTDSAAGATAFSCNLKTYNGAVGVNPERSPCGTVLESAKHSQNMLTGLVATSRITHATPASFSAHVEDRDSENSIALQQIGENPLGRSVDLMFGGGYCHFLPKSSKDGCRYDSRNLLDEAKSNYNWTTVIYNDKHMFDQLPTNESILPVISLFTPDHMSYEIDRDPKTEPSLSDMSRKAMDILYKSTENTEKGFFLMIEGSRIDMAAHSNDAATHVHEILEYQNTVDLVTKYVDEHPDTIMISTSDHETGGLSLARQVSKKYPDYLWYPDVLTKVKSSTVRLAKIMKAEKTLTKEFVVNTILKDNLGITDATTKELDELLKHKSIKQLDQYLADMVSLRAQLGWSTHGHSGVDVNLYAYGLGARYLLGSHENIQIGEFITKALDLNLTDMTAVLNKNDPTFHLIKLSEQGKLEYNEHLEHYHHVPGNLKHIEL